MQSHDFVYLEDSSYFDTVSGLHFWGSPWTPEFCDWAFNLTCGEECSEKLAMIPEETDILVTHGPPYGIGDFCVSGKSAGCRELLSEVQNRIKPILHVFGHIHEAYGVTQLHETTFVNASTCNLAYVPCREPIIVDIDVCSHSVNVINGGMKSDSIDQILQDVIF